MQTPEQPEGTTQGVASGPSNGAVRIKNGLDLPIVGAPRQEIAAGPQISSCAVVAKDFNGLKPRMLVNEGDQVQLGQPLFEDKRFEAIKYTCCSRSSSRSTTAPSRSSSPNARRAISAG
jgi:hypothetical protein